MDALRFIELGAPKDKVTVTGNIKFDISIPEELRAKESELLDQLGKDRFIWVAASTHEGEEEIILAAHKKISEKDANALLILVPRHPNRFDMVAKMAESQFVTARRSQQQLVMPGTQVYLADTMGELLLMYAVADVAFVAGSLVPRGGHNMLEAAALGKPLLTGPHLFNFAEISEMLIAAQAMKVVTDAETLAEQLTYYANDLPERAKMGKAALQVVMNNRGALDKQMAVIAAVKG
jgi:3-deoxy-D-manno-octulosonic-acid transferase